MLVDFLKFSLGYGLLTLMFLAMGGWRFRKENFVFWVLGMIVLLQANVFMRSWFVVASRWMLIMFLFIAFWCRKGLLKNNLGPLARIFMLMLICIYCGSFWSPEPMIFVRLKCHRTVVGILVLLLGATFRDENDIRKFLLAALPSVIILSISTRFGYHETGFGESDRLTINLLNSNGVGVLSAFAAVLLVAIAISFRMNLFLRIPLFLLALYDIKIMLSSGSRSAAAAAVGCLVVILLGYMRDRKKFLTIGLPMLTFGSVGVIAIFSRLSAFLFERFTSETSGFSGRDDVWTDAYYMLVEGGKWFGIGGNIQGTFTSRVFDEYDASTKWGSMLNIYFDAILETGVLGLLLWVIFFIALSFCVVRLMRGAKSPFKFLALGFCVFGLLHGVGESSPWNADGPSGLLFYIGMAIVGAGGFRWRGTDFPDRRGSVYFKRG